MNAPRLRTRKLDFKNGRVDLTHGSGGRAMAQLIAEIFRDSFDNDLLAQGNDQAVFDPPPGRMAMTTDGYVVSPLFFPGGDIGSLAVHGTVNDLAMAGAKPLHLSASFILEEGFPLADLHRIAQSMGAAAREAGVKIVTGDTKVVERGKADGVFISTTGIGAVPGRTASFGRSRASRRRHSGFRLASAIMAWPSCRAARICNSTRRSCPIPPRCTASSRRWSAPAGRICG